VIPIGGCRRETRKQWNGSTMRRRRLSDGYRNRRGSDLDRELTVARLSLRFVSCVLGLEPFGWRATVRPENYAGSYISKAVTKRAPASPTHAPVGAPHNTRANPARPATNSSYQPHYGTCYSNRLSPPTECPQRARTATRGEHEHTTQLGAADDREHPPAFPSYCRALLITIGTFASAALSGKYSDDGMPTSPRCADA
jgi:hypothetical protein